MPAEPELAQGVLGLEDRVIGRQLRLAVVVPDPGPGELFHDLLEDLHGHDGRPVVALLQAADRSYFAKSGCRSMPIQTVGGAKNMVAL